MSDKSIKIIYDDVLVSPKGDEYNHITSVDILQNGDGKDDPERAINVAIEDSRMVIREVAVTSPYRLRNEPGIKINLYEESTGQKWSVSVYHCKGRVYAVATAED